MLNSKIDHNENKELNDNEGFNIFYKQINRIKNIYIYY